MFQKLMRFLFKKPLQFFVNKLSSSPSRPDVFKKLTNLHNGIKSNSNTKANIITLTPNMDRVVIMSDLHKGNGDDADDFKNCKANYEAALYYYLEKKYRYIALGDVEELWKYQIHDVIATNEHSINIEKKFVEKNSFYKVFGNHDLRWKTNEKEMQKWLLKMYEKIIPIYECLLIKTTIEQKEINFFLTHGHQGDKTSDGNKVSKWVVANIWGAIQKYFDLNPNSPSKDFLLRNKHNKMMYEWSLTKKDTILITGHTHRPVFESINHYEKLEKQLAKAKKYNDENLITSITKQINLLKDEDLQNDSIILKKPSYFNSGCCCFNDGDITAIEIDSKEIRLVKWAAINNKDPERYVLEEKSLIDLVHDLKNILVPITK